MIIYRTGLMSRIHETVCASDVLVDLDRHKYPACGPVDSRKQILFSGYIGHPWQMFDIHIASIYTFSSSHTFLNCAYWMATPSAHW